MPKLKDAVAIIPPVDVTTAAYESGLGVPCFMDKDAFDAVLLPDDGCGCEDCEDSLEQIASCGLKSLLRYVREQLLAAPDAETFTVKRGGDFPFLRVTIMGTDEGPYLTIGLDAGPGQVAGEEIVALHPHDLTSEARALGFQIPVTMERRLYEEAFEAVPDCYCRGCVEREEIYAKARIKSLLKNLRDSILEEGFWIEGKFVADISKDSRHQKTMVLECARRHGGILIFRPAASARGASTHPSGPSGSRPSAAPIQE